MGTGRAFRHITADEIAWRLELGRDNPDYVELFWLDAILDNGWQLGVGLYRCRPHDAGRPAVTINLVRPGQSALEAHSTIEAGEFAPTAFGGSWGPDNHMTGELDSDGRPRSFELHVTAGDVAVELRCAVVCTGLKFAMTRPGYTHHRPDTGAAVGWWPVAPRAAATGEVTVRGECTRVSGAVHLEKQLSTLPLAGEAGRPTAQSSWTWGHFTAGDYTGLWTDSAASVHLGSRHFSPFVLYRGAEPVLCTFAFSSSVECFVVDERTGLPRPAVVTLRGTEGGREFFARLLKGQVSDSFELNDVPGAYYCRQVGRIEADFSHWGTDHLVGDVVHEWGTQAGNFPFVDRRAATP